MGNKIKKVLRLEVKDTGVGLYASGIEVVEELQDSIKHPAPQDDELLWWTLGNYYVEFDGENVGEVYDAAEKNLHEWYFCFDSIAVVRSWIYRNDWLMTLHNNGIVLSEYICFDSDVITGHTQSILRRYEKKFSYSIPSYFGLRPAD